MTGAAPAEAVRIVMDPHIAVAIAAIAAAILVLAIVSALSSRGRRR